MSCNHGNSIDFCEECDALDEAYRQGYNHGKDSVLQRGGAASHKYILSYVPERTTSPSTESVQETFLMLGDLLAFLIDVDRDEEIHWQVQTIPI